MGELMLFISWLVREEGERVKKYLVIKKRSLCMLR